MTTLDIGGGLGVNVQSLNDDLFDNYLHIVQRIASKYHSKISVLSELGRALVGPSIGKHQPVLLLTLQPFFQRYWTSKGNAYFVTVSKIAKRKRINYRAVPGNAVLAKNAMPFKSTTNSIVLKGDYSLICSPPNTVYSKICHQVEYLPVGSLIYFPFCGAYVHALQGDLAGVGGPRMVIANRVMAVKLIFFVDSS